LHGLIDKSKRKSLHVETVAVRKIWNTATSQTTLKTVFQSKFQFDQQSE